jgi:hypothetical protein
MPDARASRPGTGMHGGGSPRVTDFVRDHLRAARARKEGWVKENARAKLLRLVDESRDKMAIFTQFHPHGDERSPIGNRPNDPPPRPSARK